MIIEITVGKSRYKISCEEGEEEKLFRLGEKVNKKINELALKIKNTDEKTLLVISALLTEEELEKENRQILENEEIEESAETKQLNDQDLFDAVSDTMENVADYVEKLTQKIENF